MSCVPSTQSTIQTEQGIANQHGNKQNNAPFSESTVVNITEYKTNNFYRLPKMPKTGKKDVDKFLEDLMDGAEVSDASMDETDGIKEFRVRYTLPHERKDTPKA